MATRDYAHAAPIHHDNDLAIRQPYELVVLSAWMLANLALAVETIWFDSNLMFGAALGVIALTGPLLVIEKVDWWWASAQAPAQAHTHTVARRALQIALGLACAIALSAWQWGNVSIVLAAVYAIGGLASFLIAPRLPVWREESVAQ